MRERKSGEMGHVSIDCGTWGFIDNFNATEMP